MATIIATIMATMQNGGCPNIFRSTHLWELQLSTAKTSAGSRHLWWKRSAGPAAKQSWTFCLKYTWHYMTMFSLRKDVCLCQNVGKTWKNLVIQWLIIRFLIFNEHVGVHPDVYTNPFGHSPALCSCDHKECDFWERISCLSLVCTTNW